MTMLRLASFSVAMLIVTGLLFAVAQTPIFSFAPFERAIVNDMLNYQLSALPVAALGALVTFAFAGKAGLRYLNLNRAGAMKSLTGKSGAGRWETDGWIIGLMMTAAIGAAVFFQMKPDAFAFHWAYALLVIPVAASNALVEEIIFRLSYVSVGDNETGAGWYGLTMGALVFGVFHYWGIMPNGFVGAVASMFLGYVLAKSIWETKGIFWALAIHFMLDVVILFFIFNVA